MKIFNLHQQKAAGKTVESALERQLGRRVARISKVFTEEAVGDISLYKEAWRARPSSIKGDVWVITGHFYYGLHEAVTEPYTYTTAIRSPIGRIKSYYNYVMNGGEDYVLRNFIVANDLSFERFCRLGDTVRVENAPHDFIIMADNGQARLINGNPVTLGHHMTDAEFDIALENIERDFSIVAPAERAAEFTIKLLWLAGAVPPLFLPRVNRGEKDWVGDIPQKTISYLRERHRFDQKLYDYASTYFKENISTMQSRLVALAIENTGKLYTSYQKHWKKKP